MASPDGEGVGHGGGGGGGGAAAAAGVSPRSEALSPAAGTPRRGTSQVPLTPHTEPEGVSAWLRANRFKPDVVSALENYDGEDILSLCVLRVLWHLLGCWYPCPPLTPCALHVLGCLLRATVLRDKDDCCELTDHAAEGRRLFIKLRKARRQLDAAHTPPAAVPSHQAAAAGPAPSAAPPSAPPRASAFGATTPAPARPQAPPAAHSMGLAAGYGVFHQQPGAGGADAGASPTYGSFISTGSGGSSGSGAATPVGDQPGAARPRVAPHPAESRSAERPGSEARPSPRSDASGGGAMLRGGVGAAALHGESTSAPSVVTGTDVHAFVPAPADLEGRARDAHIPVLTDVQVVRRWRWWWWCPLPLVAMLTRVSVAVGGRHRTRRVQVAGRTGWCTRGRGTGHLSRCVPEHTSPMHPKVPTPCALTACVRVLW